MDIYIYTPMHIYTHFLFSCWVMSNSLQPHDCSTPDFPVFHCLSEFAQTHVHWVNDAIQPSQPLSLPSPPALSLSQHQSLFQWVSSWHLVARVLELHLQHQSFQWIFRVNFLEDWLAWSPCPKETRVFKSLLQHHSSTASILWHSAFFVVQLSHPYMTTRKNIALIIWTSIGIYTHTWACTCIWMCLCVCTCIIQQHYLFSL